MKIEPCPFCGGQAELSNTYDKAFHMEFWRVVCNECLSSSGILKTQEGTISVWNRRYKNPIPTDDVLKRNKNEWNSIMRFIGEEMKTTDASKILKHKYHKSIWKKISYLITKFFDVFWRTIHDHKEKKNKDYT